MGTRVPSVLASVLHPQRRAQLVTLPRASSRHLFLNPTTPPPPNFPKAPGALPWESLSPPAPRQRNSKWVLETPGPEPGWAQGQAAASGSARRCTPAPLSAHGPGSRFPALPRRGMERSPESQKAGSRLAGAEGRAAGSWLTQGWQEGVSEGRPWSRSLVVFICLSSAPADKLEGGFPGLL